MSKSIYFKQLQMTKQAVYARERYQLKKQKEEDIIPLSLLKKRICLQRKKQVQKVIHEELESQLFSQSILSIVHYDSE